MRSSSRPLILLILYSLSLFACQIDSPRNQENRSTSPRPPAVSEANPNPATTSPDPTAADSVSDDPPLTPAVAQTDELTIGLVGRLESLDPLQDVGLPLAIITPLLYQTLNQIDPQTAELQPGLVGLPVVAPDGLSLAYTLNGNHLTPADVKSGLEGAVWHELASIEEVLVEAPNRVIINLNRPDCILPDRLAQLPVFSQAVAGDNTPLGTGPFRLDRWDQATNALHLLPNPTYPGSPPRLARLTVRLFDSPVDAFLALQAGELDLLPLRNRPASPPPGYRSLAYISPRRLLVSFHNGDEVLAAAQVRRALSLALDRTRIVTTLFTDPVTLLPGPLHPNHWAADSTLETPPYNPDEARALLDEAGYVDHDGDGWRDLPEGETWFMPIRVFGEDPTQVALAYFVADAYRRIGVQSRAEPVAQFTILDDLFNYEYQAAVYGLTARPDLNQAPYWHSAQIRAEFGLNIAAYANPQVDAWLDEANHLPGCSPVERAALYQRVQRQIVAEQPMDFLVVPPEYLIVSQRLQGIAPAPFAPFTWNIAEWHLP